MDKITFDDFNKIDIRIGTVVKAEVPEWSHWVMKLTVDFASKAKSDLAKAKSAKDRSSERVRIEPKSKEVRSGGGEELGIKICFAGIMKFFSPEEFIGKQYPFVVNLEPKKVGPEGDMSECMMIMAVPSEDENVAPILFNLSQKVDNGTKVY